MVSAPKIDVFYPPKTQSYGGHLRRRLFYGQTQQKASQLAIQNTMNTLFSTIFFVPNTAAKQFLCLISGPGTELRVYASFT